MDPARTSFLHGLIRKEARCLLQYVREAVPWVSAPERPKLETMLALARREQETLDQLIRHSIKAKLGNPALGAYPEQFMEINFCSLAFLVPRLVADQKKRLAELEWSVLTAPEDVRPLIRELIRVKQENLRILEGLAAPQTVAG